MQETERQRIERLLREQLARVQREEPAESRLYAFLAGGAKRRGAPAGSAALPAGRSRYVVGALARAVLSGPDAIRRAYAAVPALRGRLRRAPGKRQPVAAEAAMGRAERAFDDLFAAARSDPPRAAFDGGPPPWRPRHPAGPPKHDLPNVSGASARIGAMKEASARDWGPPPQVQFPKPEKKAGHRSDLVVAALGAVLGLTCALFPWYIFFNQEQFGVQAISFGGRGHNAGRIMVDPKPGEDMSDVARQDMSRNLDLFSTGTVPARPETPDQAPGLDQQPFPAAAVEFRLVHVANGRAMIEDDAGLWIVQQGSTLPDSTRVKSIEKRKGRWVLVTSADRVIEISK